MKEDESIKRKDERRLGKTGGKGKKTENLLTKTRSLTGSHAECTEAAVRIRGRRWRRGWCVAPVAGR